MNKYYFVVWTKDAQHREFHYISQMFDNYTICEETACGRYVHEFKMSMSYIDVRLYAYDPDLKRSSRPISQFHFCDYR